MTTNAKTGPIFIGGAGRSGTSLLRVLLDSHPDICCGPELKVLPELGQWWHSLTGPLAGVMHSYGNSPEDLKKHFRTFTEGLVENFRTQSGKRRWAEKTPHNVLQMTALGQIFPDALFVHLIRDGRDVACSLVTMHWGDARTGRKLDYVQSIAAAARYWRNVIEQARRQAAEPLLADRVLELRYEGLVQQTETTLRALLKFLGERWDERVLEYHTVPHVQQNDESSTLQVQQPLSDRSIGRWCREMSQQDKADFKREAGDLLELLGYAHGAW